LTDKHMDKQWTDNKIDRQIDGLTNRWTDKQMDRQAKQMDRQADGQRNK